MTQDELTVEVASDKHLIYVDEILKTIEEAAKVRGTGIAKRKPEYVAQKIKEAKAVIALQGEKFAGFSYIETWEHKQYVTTSGLIVHPDFRGLGLAKRIKDLTFSLARTRWPHAKIFSLTSGAAVMTMNTQLKAGDFRRAHQRRGLLARLRWVRQRGCAQAHRQEVLHLHGNAIRSGGASSGENPAGSPRKDPQDRRGRE